MLSSDLILDPLPVPLGLLLLLHVDLLRLLLDASRESWLLLHLPPDLAARAVWLCLVHTVEAAVETALFLAVELMLLELLSPELVLAHRVREVAVAAAQAASVPVALLPSWRARVRHRNVGGAGAWITGW